MIFIRQFLDYDKIHQKLIYQNQYSRIGLQINLWRLGERFVNTLTVQQQEQSPKYVFVGVKNIRFMVSKRLFEKNRQRISQKYYVSQANSIIKKTFETKK